MSRVLGLSFFYHDSAAALLIDGVPLAMAEEERFSRKKHDSEFPEQAIGFVLEQVDIEAKDLDAVVFYEKPFLKLDRIFKTFFATFPETPLVFVKGIKNLFSSKLWIRELIANKLKISSNKIFFSEHHLSHAASAFFSSPYEESAVLTIDGVGEWACTTIGVGKGNSLKILQEIHFPHSLGLLYSAFTAFLGFEVNEGEYKVMGMAPYGIPRYVEKVQKLIALFEDGSYALNLEYFLFHRSSKHTFSQKFVELFGKPRDPRSKFFTRNTGWPSYFGMKPEEKEYARLAEEQEYYADIAASVQKVLEDAVVRLGRAAYELTHLDSLSYAGGVALNSVVNALLLEKTPFQKLFVQPCAGDAGGALGAALAFYAMALNRKRNWGQEHAFYGREYSKNDIEKALAEFDLSGEHVSDENMLLDQVSEMLSQGKVVGWFQGRFEWGPRALGNRSILADPRKKEMKDIVNTKIKFREPYRPFAPSVLAEYAQDFFEFPQGCVQKNSPSAFMLLVVPVRKDKQALVPAITHVDGTARPQCVFSDVSPQYWKLIHAFFEKTGIPMVLNTSFNLKGEPIVNTPQDAIRTFQNSGLDALVLGNYIVKKSL